MRIIAGEFRGRTLRAPAGQDTRPTTDRVRESLMSSVYSARGGFEGAVVLDCFAGSGALGLEALSRGAAYATFCESGRAAAVAVEANLAIAEPGTTRLARIDVERRLPPAGPAPYDLVFLDPPYAWGPARTAALVGRLDEAGLIASSALLSYEHDRCDAQAAVDAFAALEWEVASAKTYGSIAITLFKRG